MRQRVIELDAPDIVRLSLNITGLPRTAAVDVARGERQSCTKKLSKSTTL